MKHMHICVHAHIHTQKKNYDYDPKWIYSYCTYFKHKIKQFGMNEQVFGSYFTLIYFLKMTLEFTFYFSSYCLGNHTWEYFSLCYAH